VQLFVAPGAGRESKKKKIPGKGLAEQQERLGCLKKKSLSVGVGEKRPQRRASERDFGAKSKSGANAKPSYEMRMPPKVCGTNLHRKKKTTWGEKILREKERKRRRFTTSNVSFSHLGRRADVT